MLMPNVWIWLDIKGICYNLGKAMRGYIVRSGGGGGVYNFLI